MPCDTVRTIGVNLEVADQRLLDAAIKRLGGSNGRFTFKGREFTIRDGRLETSYYSGRASAASVLEEASQALKRAYSESAVAELADRYGWAVEETESNVNEQVAYMVTKETW